MFTKIVVPILFTSASLASLFAIQSDSKPQTTNEQNQIKEHNELFAKSLSGELVEIDIQKLNHKTSLFNKNDIWFSNSEIKIDGATKKAKTFYIKLRPKDDKLLPLFTINENGTTEIPHEATLNMLARRAAHFLDYESKLFNEPDGINENGLNLRHLTLKNGESFRGHVVRRTDGTVTFELPPKHVTVDLDELSPDDKNWINENYQR